MKPRIISAVVFMILMSAVVVNAAAPNLINYQGYLKQAGVAVTGTKSINFALYDASTGGTQLCTSGVQSLSVSKGIVTYKIGSNGCDLSTIDWDNPVYLELTVEGTTLSPRELVLGSAYTMETKAMNVEFTPAGDIAATDVQTAIEELDTEKVSTSGGTITGNLNVTGNLSAGSLSGTMTDPTRVLKAGDSMYGDLSNATHTISADKLEAGTYIKSSDDISASGSVYVDGAYYGDGSNLTGVVASTIAADSVDSTKIADGSVAAADMVDGSALSEIADDDGTGSGLDADLLDGLDSSAFATASHAHSGYMTASTDNWVNTTGDSMTGELSINANSNAPVLDVKNTGTGHAGRFQIDNTSSATHTLYVTNNSNTFPSSALRVNHSGTGGSAVIGNVYNNSNPYYGVRGLTTGTGAAGYFSVSNANSAKVVYADTDGSGPLFFGNHTGASGNLLQLRSGSTDKIVIDKSGNIYSSGTVSATTFTGDGSGLTGVVASGAVAKTGDTMTGSLGINAGEATATLRVYQTGSTDEAGYFEINNASAFSYAVQGKTNGSGGGGVYGYSSGGGRGVAAEADGDSGGSYAVWARQNGVGADGGYFILSNSGNPYAALRADTAGTGILYFGNHTGSSGNLLQLQSSGVNAFVVDKSGNVTASGTVTADSFSGDGSGLTGVVASGAVAKTGDTMTGALEISQSATTSLFVEQTGTTKPAGYFIVNNASGSSAIKGESNGTSQSGVIGLHTGSNGNGVYGRSSVSGNAIYGYSDGSGIAGKFQINNGANTNPSLYLTSNGTGDLLSGDHTGASGNLITLQSGGVDKFVVNKDGVATATKIIGSNTESSGRAGYFEITDSSNSARAVEIQNNGTYVGLGVYNTNSSSTGAAVSITNAGSGATLLAQQTGTGRAGQLSINNPGSTTEALIITSNSSGSTLASYKSGLGRAGYFQINNASNPNQVLYSSTDGTGVLYYGNHTGSSGDLLQLQSSSTDKLVVDKSGNMYASGTVAANSFSGDGSGLTNVTASSVAKFSFSPGRNAWSQTSASTWYSAEHFLIDFSKYPSFSEVEFVGEIQNTSGDTCEAELLIDGVSVATINTTSTTDTNVSSGYQSFTNPNAPVAVHIQVRSLPGGGGTARIWGLMLNFR